MTSGGMHATTTVRKKDPLAYVLGILAAVPISYPGPPYYLLAFAILAICGFSLFVRLTNSLNSIAICAAAAGILLSAIAIFSSLASPYKDLLGPERIITTSLFYLFFICGLTIVDYERFFRGLVDAIAVQAGLVIIAAVFYFPWHYGALVFSAPPSSAMGRRYVPRLAQFLCSHAVHGIYCRNRPARTLDYRIDVPHRSIPDHVANGVSGDCHPSGMAYSVPAAAIPLPGHYRHHLYWSRRTYRHFHNWCA